MTDAWQSHLAEGVRALAQSGEIAPDTDPEQAAISVLTAVTGGAAMLQATDSMRYLEVSLDQALNALRH
ncbi:hypothetical protein GUY61_29515 [Streptomyces sp. GC420]|nr:hypothetical protein [Streptomyces sp. GC420]